MGPEQLANQSYPYVGAFAVSRREQAFLGELFGSLEYVDWLTRLEPRLPTELVFHRLTVGSADRVRSMYVAVSPHMAERLSYAADDNGNTVVIRRPVGEGMEDAQMTVSFEGMMPDSVSQVQGGLQSVSYGTVIRADRAQSGWMVRPNAMPDVTPLIPPYETVLMAEPSLTVAHVNLWVGAIIVSHPGTMGADTA